MEPSRRKFLNLCNENSCEKQEIADGVSVRPVYLHSTCLAIIDMEPGSVLPEHKHMHEQIAYVMEGELEVAIDFQNHTTRKGDFFAVKSNKSHSYRAFDKPVKIIVASSPLMRDYVFGEE